MVPIENGFVADCAWSPDGRLLAYEHESTDHHELRVYDVASGATRVALTLPPPSYAFTLVWSPDSRLVGVTVAG